MNRAELLACPECDLLQSDSAFPRPRKALCTRCGAILYQRHDHGLERTAALTVAAAVLFALANVFPIVSLEPRTNLNLAAATGRPIVHVDRSAEDLALQGVLDRDRGDARQLLGVDLRHG